MDGRHFDNLARTLATGVSRRRMFTLMAGGAAGSLMTALRSDRALAKKEKPPKKCKESDDCPEGHFCCGADGRCLEFGDCTCGGACPYDLECIEPRCGCRGGLTACIENPHDDGNGCRDVRADPYNCGACNVICPEHSACLDGACVCDPGYTRCGDACVRVGEDPQNCGACGVACDPAACERCVGGACVSRCVAPAVCEPGLFEGECRCPTADVESCGDTCCDPRACEQCVEGACQGCEPPAVCVPGTFVSTCEACPAGQEECGGACHRVCSEGTTRDEATCACVCANECPAGRRQDPETCACECDAVCPPGQAPNPETCACECSGFQGGCAPHEVCREGACVAVCLPPGGGGVHCGTFVACDVDGGVQCHCNSCGTVCDHSGGEACCATGCRSVVTTCADHGQC